MLLEKDKGAHRSTVRTGLVGEWFTASGLRVRGPGFGGKGFQA